MTFFPSILPRQSPVGKLPEGVSFADDEDQTAYWKFNQAFQKQFGRPLEVTGDTLNNPMHRTSTKRDAFDVRTHDLTPNHLDWMNKNLGAYGLKATKSNGTESWSTGPHWHLEPTEGEQAQVPLTGVLPEGVEFADEGPDTSESARVAGLLTDLGGQRLPATDEDKPVVLKSLPSEPPLSEPSTFIPNPLIQQAPQAPQPIGRPLTEAEGAGPDASKSPVYHADLGDLVDITPQGAILKPGVTEKQFLEGLYSSATSAAGFTPEAAQRFIQEQGKTPVGRFFQGEDPRASSFGIAQVLKEIVPGPTGRPSFKFVVPLAIQGQYAPYMVQAKEEQQSNLARDLAEERATWLDRMAKAGLETDIPYEPAKKNIEQAQEEFVRGVTLGHIDPTLTGQGQGEQYTTPGAQVGGFTGGLVPIALAGAFGGPAGLAAMGATQPMLERHPGQPYNPEERLKAALVSELSLIPMEASGGLAGLAGQAGIKAAIARAIAGGAGFAAAQPLLHGRMPEVGDWKEFVAGAIISLAHSIAASKGKPKADAEDLQEARQRLQLPPAPPEVLAAMQAGPFRSGPEGVGQQTSRPYERPNIDAVGAGSEGTQISSDLKVQPGTQAQAVTPEIKPARMVWHRDTGLPLLVVGEEGTAWTVKNPRTGNTYPINKSLVEEPAGRVYLKGSGEPLDLRGQQPDGQLQVWREKGGLELVDPAWISQERPEWRREISTPYRTEENAKAGAKRFEDAHPNVTTDVRMAESGRGWQWYWKEGKVETPEAVKSKEILPEEPITNDQREALKQKSMRGEPFTDVEQKIVDRIQKEFEDRRNLSPEDAANLSEREWQDWVGSRVPSEVLGDDNVDAANEAHKATVLRGEMQGAEMIRKRINFLKTHDENDQPIERNIQSNERTQQVIAEMKAREEGQTRRLPEGVTFADEQPERRQPENEADRQTVANAQDKIRQGVILLPEETEAMQRHGLTVPEYTQPRQVETASGMTLTERITQQSHRRAVEEAVRAGHEVSDEALEGYPDLRKEYDERQTKQEPTQGAIAPTTAMPEQMATQPAVSEPVENVKPQTPQEVGEVLRQKYGAGTTGTVTERRTGSPLKVLGTEGSAYRVRNERTGKEYNIHRNAVDDVAVENIPEAHREMEAAGLDARQKHEAFKAMGIEFKDPVQMTGTVRGVDAATGKQPSAVLKYRVGKSDVDYTVVGRFPGGEKLMVLTPEAETKIIQSPYGETGNARIKGGADRAALGKVPEIDWPEVGLLSDVHPTTADVRRVNPNARTLSDLSDTELQRHFPQSWKNIQDAEGYIGEKAAKEAVSLGMEETEPTKEILPEEPETVARSRARNRQKLVGNRLSANPVETFYDTAVTVGWDIYKAAKAGAANFEDWAKDMVKRLGENVRPHLESAWDAITKPAPVWSSPLERQVKLKMSNRMPADQLRAMLDKAGLSRDELEWTNTNEFLKQKANAGEPITKKEMLEHLAKPENQIQIQDVWHGGESGVKWEDVVSLEDKRIAAEKYFNSINARNETEQSWEDVPPEKQQQIMDEWEYKPENVIRKATSPDGRTLYVVPSTPGTYAAPYVITDQVPLTELPEGYELLHDKIGGESEPEWYIYDSKSNSVVWRDIRGVVGQTERKAVLKDALADLDGPHEVGTARNIEQATGIVERKLGAQKEVRYGSYTTPGGKNQRELLLTLPSNTPAWMLREFKSTKGHFPEQFFTTEVEARRVGDERGQEPTRIRTENQGYSSSHWDELGVLAHVRMNDREIPIESIKEEYPDLYERLKSEGRDTAKGLHLEELQSDLHQAGRKKGYRLDPDQVDLVAHETESSGAYKNFEVRTREGQFITNVNTPYTNSVKTPEQAIEVARERLREEPSRTGDKGVPRAPFQKNWQDMAFKRMLREASEKGYDLMTWSTGAEQFKRWGSQRVDWTREHLTLMPRNDYSVEQGLDARSRDVDQWVAVRTEPNTLTQLGFSGADVIHRNVGPDRMSYAEAEQYIKDHPSWKMQMKEQSGGHAGGVDIEGEALRQNILKSNYQNIDSKPLLRRLLEATMDREKDEYSPENWKKHMDVMTDKVWARMQIEDVGTHMPRKEGLEKEYDKDMPGFARSYGKKFGAKVGEVGLPGTQGGAGDTGGLHIAERPDGSYWVYPTTRAISEGRYPQGGWSFPTKAEARQFFNEKTQLPMHAIDISPKMRDSVIKAGQSPFSSQEGEPPAVTDSLVKLQEQMAAKKRNPPKTEIRQVNPQAGSLADLKPEELAKFPEAQAKINEAKQALGDKAAVEAVRHGSVEVLPEESKATEEPEIVRNSRTRLRDHLNGGTLSVNPIHTLYDTAVVTGWDVYKGAKEFKEWAKRMVERLGERARPYLDEVWAKMNNQAPQWYSPLENTIKLKMPNRASAEQVKGILRGGGFIVKGEGGLEAPNDEAHWTGTYDFLQRKSSAKEQVTKQEVLDHLAQNQVQLTERQFSEAPEDFIRNLRWRRADGGDESLYPAEQGDWIAFDSDGAMFSTVPGHLSLTEARDLAIRGTDSMGVSDIGKTQPKYTAYTTPGGSNQREFTLSLKAQPKRDTRQFELTGGHRIQRITTQGDAERTQSSIGDWMITDKNNAPEMITMKGSLDEQEALGVFMRSSESAGIDDIVKEIGRISKGELGSYKVPSAHQYGIPEADINRIAIIRTNDRVGPNEEKILHVDEYQDDLQNQIQGLKKKLSEGEKNYSLTREQAYQRAKSRALVDGVSEEIFKKAWGQRANWREEEEGDEFPWSQFGRNSTVLLREIEPIVEKRDRVPVEKKTLEAELQRLESLLPFRGKSHELAFKRILDFAVKNGYDKVSWATGQQVADRYDLSKYITELHYKRAPAGGGTYTWDIAAKRQVGEGEVLRKVGVSEDELEELVGKDVASRITRGIGEQSDVYRTPNSHVLRDLDLSIGGESKKHLYDTMIPNFLSKYTKRWGGKVEETTISTEVKTAEEAVRFTGEDFDPDDFAIDEDGTVIDLRKSTGVKVHALTITPEMKDAINKTGQPLFGSSEGEPPMVVNARMRLAETFSGKKLNVNPIQDMMDMALVTGIETYKLARKFGGWSNQMVKKLGEQVKPHLESVYEKVKLAMDVNAPGQGGFVKNPFGKSVPDEALDKAREFFQRGGGNLETFKSYMKVNLEDKYSPSVEKNIFRIFQDARRGVPPDSSGSIPKGATTDFDSEDIIPPRSSKQELSARGARPKANEQNYQEGETSPEEYRPEMEPETLSQWWYGTSKLQKTIDVANVPRTVMASTDLSAPFRQGDIFALTEPVQGLAKPTKEMFRAAFASREKMTQMQQEFRLHPDFDKAVMSGVEFTGQGLGRHEEAFMSGLADKVPFIRLSEQAYTTFLNSQRLNVFSKYAKELETAGANFDTDPFPYYSISRWINAATGRGDLGNINEAYKDLASTVLFSPRYIKSRIDIMNPKEYYNMDPTARKIASRKMFEFIGVVASTLGLAAAAGAKVVLNPDDPDFGKIVIGNTHYDITAGLGSYIRNGFLIGRDFVQGKFQSAAKRFLHFGRGKLAPVPGSITNLYLGTDFLGKPVTLGKEAAGLVTPMVFKDFYEGWKDSGMMGAVKAAPSFFGMSVSTYPSKERRAPKGPMEQKLYDKYHQQFGEPLADETKARLAAEDDIAKSIKVKDWKVADTKTQKYIKDGILPPGKEGDGDNATMNRIVDKALLTPLQYLVKHNQKIDMEAALDAFLDPQATDEEKRQLAPIVLAKEDAYEKRDEAGGIPEIQRKRVEKKIQQAVQAGILRMAQPSQGQKTAVQ